MVTDRFVTVRTPETAAERPAVLAAMADLSGMSDADLYRLAAEPLTATTRARVLAARRVVNDPAFDRDAARTAAGMP